MSTNEPTKREMKSIAEIKEAKKKDDAKKKKIIAIIIAVLIVIAVIIFGFGYSKGFRTIKLLEIFNKVTFDRDGQKDVAVYDGMSLKAGDTIKTGDEESFARLVLDDDKYIYIEENSEVNFEMAGRKNSSKTTIHLDHGAIVNELEHKLTDKQSFEVVSPNSLMAVRGTRFRVSTYVGSDGVLYTRVSVFEGQVQCWLVYPDGTVSDESHMAEVGSEVLMYYDDENGITDFAKSNEIGTYYAKKPGEYVSPIRYAQLPKQVVKYLYDRSTKEGVVYEAFSEKELEQYINMDVEYEEPIIAHYREEIAEYIAEHPEEFEDKKSVANAGEDAVVDTTPTPAPLDDNTPDGTTPNDTDDANAEDGVDVANNENDGNNGGAPNNAAANNAVAKTTPTPTPSLADLIKQYYEEILNHPDVYAHLLPTPTPTPVVEVASAEESQPESNETPAQEQHDDNSNNTPAAPAAPAGGSDPGSDPGTPGGDPSGGVTYDDLNSIGISNWPNGARVNRGDDGSINGMPDGYRLSRDADGSIHLDDGSGYDRVADVGAKKFVQVSSNMPENYTDNATGITYTKTADYDSNGNIKYVAAGRTDFYTVDAGGWHLNPT